MEYADVAAGMKDWARYELGFKIFRKGVDGVAACEEVTRKALTDGAYKKLENVQDEVMRSRVAVEMGSVMFDRHVPKVFDDALKRISKLIVEECLLDDGAIELNYLFLKRRCIASPYPILNTLASWSTLDKSLATFPTLVIPYLTKINLAPPITDAALSSYYEHPAFTGSVYRQALPAFAVMIWHLQKALFGLARGKVRFGDLLRMVLQDVRKTCMGVAVRGFAAVVTRKLGLGYRWESPLNLLFTAGISYTLHATKLIPFLTTDTYAAWTSSALIQTPIEASFWPWQSTATVPPPIPYIEEILKETPVPEMKMPPMPMPGMVGGQPPQAVVDHTPQMPDLD
eukprot:TRINITY_DN13507_c1_g1_i2.p1 TRINITY_DN13507_c1_g1~~TRINITY_DN13507_c1_g1_i2.p1  ORF type:complete len:342 (+),score=94.95 TRINITY_DN13507_c1_g1_i2:35-1060(+)